MRQISIGLFIVLSVGIPISSIVANASEPCRPIAVGPRLDLTTPFGCSYSHFINEQIENPNDRFRPRSEQSPDTARRLKTLKDWRNASQSNGQAGGMSSGGAPSGQDSQK